MHDPELKKKHRRTVMVVAAVFFAMVGLSFAAVPLYDLFCRVTGFAGTTQVAERSADQIHEREITVRFDSSVSRDLPWRFKPELKETTVKLGQDGLIAYQAKNLSARPTAGTALYNVTPTKAGKYFNKIACFCFGEQILDPGEEADLPVLFFIDPELAEDPNMEEVTTITLSYTFFKTETPELERAMENFYNESAEAPSKQEGT